MAERGIVVITGAGSGIGLATAKRLAADGWPVACLDRDADALERAKVAIAGPEVLTHTLDVADEVAVGAAIEALAAGRRLVGLVNSAGIASDVSLVATDVSQFRRIVDINVIGTFLLARAVEPHLRAAGGGSIVNIASVSGMRGNLGRTAYGASKGAVITMTKVWAAELAESRIRVNAVAPGPVETPMVKAVHSAASREAWLTHLPLGRYAEPEEIASAVAFLIDERQSSYITGHVLAVDGGFTASGTIRPRPTPQP